MVDSRTENSEFSSENALQPRTHNRKSGVQYGSIGLKVVLGGLCNHYSMGQKLCGNSYGSLRSNVSVSASEVGVISS